MCCVGELLVKHVHTLSSPVHSLVLDQRRRRSPDPQNNKLDLSSDLKPHFLPLLVQELPKPP